MNSILVAKPVRTFDLKKISPTKRQRSITYQRTRTVSYMCHRQSSSVMFFKKFISEKSMKTSGYPYTESSIDTTLGDVM
jgi:hypothetical protein